MKKHYNVLLIDAWRNEDGWTWNGWLDARTIELDIDATPRKILFRLRKANILSHASAGKVELIDDGYNLVVCAKGTGQPFLAIEYGSTT